MAGIGWYYEAVRRILGRANRERADMEAMLVDELLRYLEGKPGVFSDAAGDGAVISLQGIRTSISLPGYPEEDATELDALMEQADAMGLEVLEMLALEVNTGQVSLAAALNLAFHYGRQMSHLVPPVERLPLCEQEIDAIQASQMLAGWTQYPTPSQPTRQVVEAVECAQ